MRVQKDKGTLHDEFRRLVVFTNGVLLLMAVLVNFADIVSRNVFGASLPWATQVTVWLVVLACYLSIGPQLKDGTHIRVEFIVEKLKGTSQKLIDVFSSICILVFSIIGITSGIAVVLFTYNGEFTETLGTWNFPVWVIYLFCFLIGATVMTVYSIYLFLVAIMAIFSNSHGKV